MANKGSFPPRLFICSGVMWMITILQTSTVKMEWSINRNISKFNSRLCYWTFYQFNLSLSVILWFSDRLNPLENYTEDELFERYRFRQATIVYLMGMIFRNLLDSKKKQTNALPSMLQLFACLRFFATGAYHKLIGDGINVS